MRLGPGPVFVSEFVTSARRWQVYAIRVLFVTGLLAAMLVVRLSQAESNGGATIQCRRRLVNLTSLR